MMVCAGTARKWRGASANDKKGGRADGGELMGKHAQTLRMHKEEGSTPVKPSEELARLLSVQPRMIRGLFKPGEVRAKKTARKWYIMEAELRAYFEEREVKEAV
jgi:hypothetical protein